MSAAVVVAGAAELVPDEQAGEAAGANLRQPELVRALGIVAARYVVVDERQVISS
jgi:hypothetical protein